MIDGGGMDEKWIYHFDEGNKQQKDLLGGKGANLAEMTAIGLPVPEGFTITTAACIFYDQNEQVLWDELISQVTSAMKKLEEARRQHFGGVERPLFVSVRSGASVSMPGMMDTILNLGLNDQSVEALAKETGHPAFAYDCYRRFIQMYADVVCHIPKEHFDAIDWREDSLDQFKEQILLYQNVFKEQTGEEFPQSPYQQLHCAIEAVFQSWHNKRAVVYRTLHGISHDMGTAVNIQRMVFGNKGDTSGTGVAFTRNPSNGTHELYGEYLMNAQGEDVVAGIRTPKPITSLKEQNDLCYQQLCDAASLLETHYRDMQDIEFTIEEGVLFLLQTRNGKRTAKAALAIAVSMVKEGRIDKEEALKRIEPNQLNQLLHPTFDQNALADAHPIARGLPASPGAAMGQIYFQAAHAVEAAEKGQRVLLVRQETSPEDIEGMICADGIVTSRGGMTSHAAVVARGMGKCCIAGCYELQIDEVKRTVTVNGTIYEQGDTISLDGTTGKIYAGALPTIVPALEGDFKTIMSWADECRMLDVYANADMPSDVAQAMRFGCQGIGLCRTEHMFFDEARIALVRKMILTDRQENRQKYLNQLLPLQREDFTEIFRHMNGLPVTIRLLDPPLHEFLPTDTEKLQREMGWSEQMMAERITSLKEMNPMLGHRGCRLIITYPEIARMQVRAIMEAAVKTSANVHIMIPLVGAPEEIQYLKRVIQEEIEQVFTEQGTRLHYQIGTMIEVPRATLVADEIALHADFFSFGTNDLTQMTYGFSRDDVGRFLKDYFEHSIMSFDPFQTIDTKGVGTLLKMAVEKGRATKKELTIGICGEHGGDPASILFFHRLGLHYVSCSPYRVPIAKLAAAQAALTD